MFGESAFGALATVFFMSMVPVVELRGAIPLGIAVGLPPALACAAAVLGNLVPAPLIILLGRRTADFLRGTRFFGPRIDWLERQVPLLAGAGRRGSGGPGY